MAPPVILASDIMTGSRVLLNDQNIVLYDNTSILPMLKMANQELEQLMVVYDISDIREKSAVIDVAANAVVLLLPDDFLFPIRLYERADGSTSDDDWVEMGEMEWPPERTKATTLDLWSFSDASTIKFIGATTAREVKLYYERMLAVISGSNSPTEEYKIRPWLEAKTAELAARFIGMNETVANTIRDNKLARAEDNLIRSFVLNMQGVRHRRGQFTSRQPIMR